MPARTRSAASGGAGRGWSTAPGDPFPVLPILLHGDAAFAGQGVVAETLNLSGLAGYRTGGTVHVVINNQLGFTTAPEAARSSVYPTDVAKMVQAPIFHVNGDDPEACARAARLAFGFRQAFHKDVVIDMVCYRRHGHNEGDDPSYTQPLMYALIDAKRSVRKLYTEALVRRGDISLEEAEQALDDFSARLQAALDETRAEAEDAPPAPLSLPGVHPARPVSSPGSRPASIPRSIARLATVVRSVPEGFVLHPKLARQFEQRDKVVADGEIDWALGEALAFGSLLLEGTNVRVTGQDTRRGTFSQRHAVLVDYETGVGARPPGRARRRPVHHPGLAPVGVRLRGLRVRLLGRGPRRPGGLGGPVRRLLERRRDHRRQLPGGRRGQVGPEVRSGPAPAPRVRGPGPRALVGPDRAVPDAVRPGQPPGRPADHRGAVLPPAPGPGTGAGPQAADRVHPEVAAAGPPGAVADRRLHVGFVRRGARRSGGRPTGSTGPGSTGWCCAPARWPSTPSAGGTSSATPAPTWPWSGSSSSTRGRRTSSPRCCGATRRRRRWCGCRRSPRTWAPGTSSTAGSTGCCAATHILRHVSRAESASPASGSAALHRLELEDLLVRAVG